ncbi:hypothetical protein [Kordia sp.]|uniref:hypothetical protein n=1 Tax=Kordia sp. TaxID=1965332 RepID=UPI003D6B5EEF
MKTNLFKSVFILLLVSSIGFYACSEDTVNKEADQTTTAKNSRTNPLEYIGIEHNAFMEVFTQKLEESYANRDWSRVEFLSDDYRATFATVMNDAFHTRYTRSNSTVSFQEEVYDQLNINEWYNCSGITTLDIAASVLNDTATSRDREFTMNLLNDLFNAANNARDNSDAFNTMREVVLHHEALILAQDWGADERYALGAVAVAKHSRDFWENYDFSVFRNAARAQGQTGIIGKRDIDPRSGIIVGADTAGYVVGGVVGGTGGSFAGPAGTVGGVLGGKAAGAWIGSAGAAAAVAIYDAWCDFFG